MTELGNKSEGVEDAVIFLPFQAFKDKSHRPVSFERREFDQLLRLYGKMVAVNEWRDYAIDHLPDRAVFSVFRRANDAPLYQIVKDPRLARKQGLFYVVNSTGLVQKRGSELSRVLEVFDRRLKLVGA